MAESQEPMCFYENCGVKEHPFPTLSTGKQFGGRAVGGSYTDRECGQRDRKELGSLNSSLLLPLKCGPVLCGLDVVARGPINALNSEELRPVHNSGKMALVSTDGVDH